MSFDITGFANTACAGLTLDSSGSGLCTINLGSGAATLVGNFGIAGSQAGAPQRLRLTVAAIPEPSTCALMLAGLPGIGWAARKRVTGA